MKLLYAFITLAACAIMWIVTQKYLQASNDLHALAVDIHAIREAIAPPAAHVSFRTGQSAVHPLIVETF